MPKREAFDQVHVAVVRHIAVVAVRTVVLGQLFYREREISAATLPVLQLPVHGRPDYEETEHQAGKGDGGLTYDVGDLVTVRLYKLFRLVHALELGEDGLDNVHVARF